ncbi:uncharacterized protein [Branchiostoma lanceolatum]|uniref:uncharacterized protein n=1 Tax=Branchiostoma lanceolatum TaxID=7740 RepID=UPI0034512A0B
MAAKDETELFSPQSSSDFSVSAVSGDHEFLSSPEESPRRVWDAGDTCYQGASMYQDIHYDNKNTQRAMRSAVVTFRDFLIDSGLNPAFEDMPPEKLDAVLTLFFSNARKRNRELYKWSTFSGIRYGIYRHLLSRVPSVDIMHSRDFAGSQQAFNEKLKMIKESGKGEINHTPMMTPEDTERLYRCGVMSTDNPQGLQRKVFFELLYFLLKQKRGHVLRDLMKDDVRFAVNQDGKWYAYLIKNDGGQATSLEEHEKVYEIPGCPLCPIQSLLKYKSKLHPSCDFLFQQPKKLPLAEDVCTAAPFADEPIWYNDKPTGKNALSHMMSAISEDAGLSQMYSNSSIRSCAEMIDGQLTLQLPVLLKKISNASHKLQGQSGGLNSSLSQTFAASVPTTSYSVPDPQMFQPQSLQQTFNPGPSLSEINQDSAVSQRIFPSQSMSHSYNTVPMTQPPFHANSFEGNSSFDSETSRSGEDNFPSTYQCSSSASKSSTSPRSTPPSRLNQGGAKVNYHRSRDNFVQQETVQSSSATSFEQPVSNQRSTTVTANREVVARTANTHARNRPSNYAEQLLNHLNQQRRDRKMCDVTLTVGRQTFAAHKGILVAESKYFRNLFCNDSEAREVELPSPLVSGVRALLDYMYSGVLELTQDNVNEVFSAANFLQMERAASLCLEFLERTCQR